MMSVLVFWGGHASTKRAAFALAHEDKMADYLLSAYGKIQKRSKNKYDRTATP